MKKRQLAFEETLGDVWEENLGVAEVALPDPPLTYIGAAVTVLAFLVMGQVLFLGVLKGVFYGERAEANLGYWQRVPAPRGIIFDRSGRPLVENKAVFSVYLDVKSFLKEKELQEPTLKAIETILGIPPDEIKKQVADHDLERSGDPIPLLADIAHPQLVALKEAELSTLRVTDTFTREYLDGNIFSSLLGYVGIPSTKDIARDASLRGENLVGKSGLEVQYDKALRGTSGIRITIKNARGGVLGEEEQTAPQIGLPLTLTVDGEFQRYFHNRFAAGLANLGRISGVGMAIDPRNGEVLAFMNFPSFDNNVFTSSGKGEQRKELLTSASRPLFNRAVGGAYTPGSTIKPLVGVAALAEDVISPERTIFSPGYLDIPNPYQPDKPTRYEDWRYQGNVDLSSAIAQSSNVYFYTVGGGTSEIKGLGLERLKTWWKKFGLGAKTGIDLPGEVEGFIPSVEWKQKTAGRQWFLGDTYNVSIGQGDLLLTPIQLLSYIGAIANGGTVYEPHLKKDTLSKINADLTAFIPEIREVQQGMREGVIAPLGSSHTMSDLPFPVWGKTGSAQVKGNREVNAFFVGYAAPSEAEQPRIAILILVENSKEGSLNAVPIAKDVLRWYYEHRMKE